MLEITESLLISDVRARDRAAWCAARARRPGRDRRLRHWLLLAELHPPAADRHPQDRQDGSSTAFDRDDKEEQAHGGDHRPSPRCSTYRQSSLLIAEGVERPAQHERLKELGCDGTRRASPSARPPDEPGLADALHRFRALTVSGDVADDLAPHHGQSSRSFWASWSQWPQKRRFSSAQGSSETVGARGSSCATGSSWSLAGLPVDVLLSGDPPRTITSRPVEGVRMRYF
jgi:hypothetical protein